MLCSCLSRTKESKMQFYCRAVLIEGRKLGTAREWHFKCDDTTTVGWIREEVRKVVEHLHDKKELDGTGFHLMRNMDRYYDENELKDDFVTVHSLRHNNSEECIMLILPQIVLPPRPQ